MNDEKTLTHFNKRGRARMVDVSGKAATHREATAVAKVIVNEETFCLIKEGGLAKGDVLGVAQVAGVMAAKKTPEIIPMCHPIWISGADIEFDLDEEKFIIGIKASVKCKSETGVEMEALTAVSVAALTIYDMCKAVQKDIEITDIYLVTKTGGKTGEYSR